MKPFTQQLTRRLAGVCLAQEVPHTSLDSAKEKPPVGYEKSFPAMGTLVTFKAFAMRLSLRMAKSNRGGRLVVAKKK